MRTLHKLRYLELNSTLQQARVELWIEEYDKFDEQESLSTFNIELIAKKGEFFTSWEIIDSRLRGYLVIPESIHVHGVIPVNNSSIPLDFEFNLYCE